MKSTLPPFEVRCKSIVKLCKYHTLMIRRNAFLILNVFLHSMDIISRLNIKDDSPSCSLSLTVRRVPILFLNVVFSGAYLQISDVSDDEEECLCLSLSDGVSGLNLEGDIFATR